MSKTLCTVVLGTLVLDKETSIPQGEDVELNSDDADALEKKGIVVFVEEKKPPKKAPAKKSKTQRKMPAENNDPNADPNLAPAANPAPTANPNPDGASKQGEGSSAGEVKSLV